MGVQFTVVMLAGLPTRLVERQIRAETVLLLLGLLVHLGVLVMMVVMVMVIGMARMERRPATGCFGHERLSVKAERAQRLTGQIHGRRAGVVAGVDDAAGSGHRSRVKIMTDVRCQMGRHARVVAAAVGCHCQRRNWARAWRAVVVAAASRRRRVLTAQSRAARIVAGSSRSVADTAAADQSRTGRLRFRILD